MLDFKKNSRVWRILLFANGTKDSLKKKKIHRLKKTKERPTTKNPEEPTPKDSKKKTTKKGPKKKKQGLEPIKPNKAGESFNRRKLHFPDCFTFNSLEGKGQRNLRLVVPTLSAQHS